MSCNRPEQKKGEDYIIRATGANHQVRIFAATTRETVEYARQVHHTSPVATAALGRLLTAGAMMGSMQKGEEDLITLQIKCGGPIKGLTVTADGKARVKGYVENPMVMLPPSKAGKLDVGGALDMGVLSVIKDMGLKEPYVGQTHLVSGEIAEDLTYYFATSEQVNSSVALGVLMEKDNTVKRAGGFILQLMPFAKDTVIEKLEKNIGALPSVTTMLEEGDMPEDIIGRVLEGMDVEIMDKLPTGFECNCSKERVERAIISIGREEIQSIIDDEKPIEVNCHFCNSHYIFTLEDLKTILKKV
ncbi:Hsp33 family molecular chaperone HslO [Frisingicoccus sp.]|uniref:Hsp33 family molecular chaperone HslO n=1 Tax=Frisingicoccus sp. TaxID=1918627 RepID=UPI003AB5536E